MAEAHSIARVSATTISAPRMQVNISNEGLVLKIDRGALTSITGAIRRSLFRSYYDVRCAIINGVWPATPGQWALTVGFAAMSMSMDKLPVPQSARSGRLGPLWRLLDYAGERLWSLESWVPRLIQVSRSSRALFFSAAVSTVAVLGVAWARRYIMRGLLMYQGWLWQQPRRQSIVVLLWGACLRLTSGKRPMLYSNQPALPRMPVPSLNGTVQRYLRSVRALQDDEQFEETKKMAEDFARKEGKKLQRYLCLKSWISDNYVTDWWEKYVYLMGRDSIMINSNYYACDSRNFCTTHVQVARAANIIDKFLVFKRDLDLETLEPQAIRGTVPMCMEQYRRMFSTTRIPGRELDTILHFDRDESRHVVVFHQGAFFTLPVFHQTGEQLDVLELEAQLKWIVDSSARRELNNPAEADIPALTAENRTVWADARQDFFSAGVNKASLDEIERAIMFVVLEDFDLKKGDVSAQGRSLIHGSGSSRWFDKSITFVCYKNGRVGLNCEHSWADAPVIAHVWEFVMWTEMQTTTYNEKGYNKRPPSSSNRRALPPPRRLEWELTPECCDVISTAVTNAKTMIKDFQLKVYTHDKYGKGFIKKCKLSPDAYIQMALQYAYYLNSGHFAHTYESSMTRLYRHGRTETVRPATVESAAFVKSMLDKSKTKDEQKKALAAAGQRHQESYRLCMTGKGVDRHLFALYIVSKGVGVDSPFLKRALSEPWRLSTSQQPQNQTTLWNPNDPEESDRICPGGGFGPVAQDGYGVSYMIGGENLIFFHISSHTTSEATDSDKFAECLEKALGHMKEIFE